MVHFREIEPHPALAPFVKCFWTMRGSGHEAPVERILPDGTFEMVFHVGDPFTRAGEEQARAMWVGEIRRPVLVKPSPNIDVLGVRFRTGGASAFLRIPMRELRDAMLPLELLFPTLGERVLNAKNTLERIAIIEKTLQPHADLVRSRHAVSEIVRRDGDIRMRDLASLVGSTPRTLERVFDHEIGIGPKQMARLARFHAALRGRDAAYFDDAHRIHEFRAFSGVTPTEFQREQNRMNDAFVGNLQDSRAGQA